MKDRFRRVFKKGLETNGKKENELPVLILEKYKKFIEHFITQNPTVVESLQDAWAHQALAGLLKNPNMEPPGALSERN